MIKKKIYQLVASCYGGMELPNYQVDYPPEGMGDYSLNIALKLATTLSENPMVIANELAEKMRKLDEFHDYFAKAEIVHPGFINFYLNPKFINESAMRIIDEGKNYGRYDNKSNDQERKNKKVQIEFISANPTGPLHLGNGRGGFYGDVLANVLLACGYEVEREYYVNDIGKQVNILAESVLRKNLHQSGLKVPYPEYCYQGKYIDELAKKLKLYNYTISSLQKIEEIRDKIKDQVLKLMLKELKNTTEKTMGIKFDNWFLESSLYENGEDSTVETIKKLLKEKDLIYESEGATWLKTSQYGDDKDRVLIKGTGDQTYFLSDIAYQYNKLAIRKFDKVVMIWGADHHGYINRMKAVVSMLGFPGQAEFLILQLVRLMSEGKEIRMSKRKGTFVTVEELVEEVGLDVARFFFLKYTLDTHMDFDLDLAMKQSEDNPVFYVQYAHARICSIIKEVSKQKTEFSEGALLEYIHASEISLLKELIKYPDMLEDVARNYGVHKLPNYAIDVATKFHNFYANCRVIDNEEVKHSRLVLITATKTVLANVLSLMGISAPELMEQRERKIRHLI